jgi:hypothetical protein
MGPLVAVGWRSVFLSFGGGNLLERDVQNSSDRSFELEAGATRLLHVGEGSTLVAVRGCLRLNDAQRWMAERAWTPCVELAEGEAHLCCAGSWFRIDASSDCEVLVSGLADRSRGASPFERIIRRWREAFARTALS